MLHRRIVLTGLLVASSTPAFAGSTQIVRVWRDPNCGCCKDWVAHLRRSGFAVEDHVVGSLAPIRRRLGTPDELLSCHAGEVEGLALEGHVPAVAIRRALAQRPPGMRGLAVPGMPIGSPGMEVPGSPDESYDVIAFGPGHQRVFMRFVGGRAV
jgi:hypothetical protein